METIRGGKLWDWLYVDQPCLAKCCANSASGAGKVIRYSSVTYVNTLARERGWVFYIKRLWSFKKMFWKNLSQNEILTWNMNNACNRIYDLYFFSSSSFMLKLKVLPKPNVILSIWIHTAGDFPFTFTLSCISLYPKSMLKR